MRPYAVGYMPLHRIPLAIPSGLPQDNEADQRQHEYRDHVTHAIRINAVDAQQQYKDRRRQDVDLVDQKEIQRFVRHDVFSRLSDHCHKNTPQSYHHTDGEQLPLIHI